MKSFHQHMQAAKRILRTATGKDLFVKTQVDCSTVILGNAHAKWGICTRELRPESVVYSFGIGQDISFDIELIEQFGLTVHAFDPTPRSKQWLSRQSLPEKFIYHEYGIAPYDGTALFNPPQNEFHVSYSMLSNGNPADSAVAAEVFSLTTIMKKLGHAKIDVLKMDIEGAEYQVIPSILSSRVSISQLLVEFHHRQAGIGAQSTRETLQRLNEAQFRIFYISDSGEEFGFLNTREPAALSSCQPSGRHI